MLRICQISALPRRFMFRSFSRTVRIQRREGTYIHTYTQSITTVSACQLNSPMQGTGEDDPRKHMQALPRCSQWRLLTAHGASRKRWYVAQGRRGRSAGAWAIGCRVVPARIAARRGMERHTLSTDLSETARVRRPTIRTFAVDNGQRCANRSPVHLHFHDATSQDVKDCGITKRSEEAPRTMLPATQVHLGSGRPGRAPDADVPPGLTHNIPAKPPHGAAHEQQGCMPTLGAHSMQADATHTQHSSINSASQTKHPANDNRCDDHRAWPIAQWLKLRGRQLRAKAPPTNRIRGGRTP